MNNILPDLMASPKPVKLPQLTTAAMQGKLMCLRDDSIFADAVRAGAVTDLKGTLKMIRDQAEDNFELVSQVIGVKLLLYIQTL